MNLDVFLIADAVAAPPDGKFYVHGGGLTRLTVPTVPWAIPQIGVFARFEVSEAEMREAHEIRIKLTDPDGGIVGVPLPTLSWLAMEPHQLVDGEQRFLVLAINLAGISVGREGLHRLTISVDDEELGARPLPVVKLRPELLEEAEPPAHEPPSSTPRPNRATRRGQQPRQYPR